jgi:hypothetical protein
MLIVAFGIAPREACAAPAVTNCDDSGPGSLRAAVTGAADTDTVDATQLQCSTISLTTGAILVGQSALTISGPGNDKLAIDGTSNMAGYPLIANVGTGSLTLDNMSLQHSLFYTTSASKYGGGCIFSGGDLTLDHVVLSNCSVVSGNKAPRGGAAYTRGNLFVTDSAIVANLSRATVNAKVYIQYYHAFFYYSGSGGGVFANGNATVDHSTIAYNATFSDYFSSIDSGSGGGIETRGSASITGSAISSNISGEGSGVMCAGSLTITGSTISGNRSGSAVWMPKFVQSPPNQSGLIEDSTISGNLGTAFYASAPASIYNSTIAFNRSSVGMAAAVSVGQTGATLLLDSSIIADNFPIDVAVGKGGSVVAGAYSIVVHSSVAVPGASSVCPQLEPLADNGGVTLTHALRHTSPAIDAGSNPQSLQYDERGVGYPRVFGAKADVGAFEWKGGLDETLFRDGFDGPNPFCELAP